MPEPRSKSISLLLVDDSITLRQWWKAILSGIPGVLVVAEAASAAQALELFETLKPDAILLEVDLDRKDGCDILRKVHAMDPGCFIITVSTDRNQECQRKCYDSGADYHFSKLDPIDGLIAVLNARLGR